jgi:hypothetical protein
MIILLVFIISKATSEGEVGQEEEENANVFQQMMEFGATGATHTHKIHNRQIQNSI